MHAAAAQGTLKERPLPRLLQQLYRKQFTGHFVVSDETQDRSEVYLREGSPVHVCRPVDTDRLDNLLVEYGLVSAEVLAEASAQVTPGQRLGDLLERMGALDKEKLADVLKAQVTRKLTRLFFVGEGHYAVYLGDHGFGKGDDLPLMRVDPRTLMYPGIRAAYNLPRVTRELARLAEQRFRLADISASFVAALGVSPEDPAVVWLRKGWMTLDDLDAVTSRPFEVRSAVLALYYADCLDREAVGPTAADSSEVPAGLRRSTTYRVARSPSDSDIDSASAVASGTGAAAAPRQSAPDPAVTPARPVVVPPAATVIPAVPLPTGPVAKVSSQVSSPPVAGPVAPTASSPAPPSPRYAPTIPLVGAAAPTAAQTSVHRRPSGSLPAVTAGVPVGVPPSASVPVVRAPFVSSVRASAPSSPSAPSGRPAASGKPAVASGKPAASAATAATTRAAIREMAERLEKSTHFEILGIAVNATSDEVGTAFVRAARQFHPDRLAGAGLSDLQPVAERILARINEAAMVLGSPPRRAEYVASLMAGAQSSQNLPTLLEAENQFLKGEVFLKKGDHARAIEAFTAAIKNNPDEPQYRAYLAWTRFDDPRSRKESISRETLKTIEGVIKERPKFARGFYWVGELWKFLNESAKAEQAFREAVRIDDSFIEASRELRLIEMRKGKSAAKSAKPDAKGRFWKR